VLEGGRSLTQAAQDLGIARSVISRWVTEAKVNAGKGKPGALTTAEREELVRLRRQVKLLQQDREILKKAAAFFAKENA
jgi:transposase